MFFKNHSDFSIKLKKLNQINQISDTVKEWVICFDKLGKVEAINISGTLNTLSKLHIFDKKWKRKDQENFKKLIVKLAEKGSFIVDEFDPWNIANSLNALSKWNIEELKGAKEFVVELIKQGNQSSKEFNSQGVVNSLNALSKWNIEELKGAKEFIVKLINQPSKKFNSQDIANSYDALYKFSVFDNKKWDDDQIKSIKNFIINLAEKGEKIYREFDSQGVANTFNAFLKLDIFNDSKWTSKEQNKLKFLIINLASLNEVYKNYNLKDIYRTYKALCRWNVSNMDKWSNNKFKFEALITKLKKQIYIIAKKQKLLESCIDIRFASKIIQDLPELKLKDLIISESEFLIPLMQCLSISVNNSNANVLKDSWSRTDILSGLQILYEIVSKIEDRSGLKEVFDTDLSKIYSKLVKVKVIYANEVLKEVNKLDKLGIIKNGKLLCKSKQFTVDLQVTNEDYDKACDRQIPTSDPSHNAEKKEEDNQLLHELCTKDLSNQKIEASSAVRNILLQDDKMSYTTRRCIGVVGNKLSSLFNFATGYFFQVFPPYEQAKDTGSSQPLKVMEDKIIETVKQIISERVELEKSNINFKQMKKKIVQRFNKGNFDDITKSIALRIFEEGSRDLKAKFKNVKSCKQIVERRINQLIQDILKNRNSMPEVNDVKEQKTSFKPESHLNDTAVQGHITQDKVKLIS